MGDGNGDERRKQASVLTDTQFKYLTGETDPARPWDVDGRIRQRIEEGLRDFGVLFENLDEEQRRKIFGPHYAEHYDASMEARGESPGEGTTAKARVQGALAFLLWALNIDGEPPYGPHGHRAFERFSQSLKTAIDRYLLEKWDVSADVDVSIELEDVDRGDELREE